VGVASKDLDDVVHHAVSGHGDHRTEALLGDDVVVGDDLAAVADDKPRRRVHVPLLTLVTLVGDAEDDRRGAGPGDAAHRVRRGRHTRQHEPGHRLLEAREQQRGVDRCARLARGEPDRGLAQLLLDEAVVDQLRGHKRGLGVVVEWHGLVLGCVVGRSGPGGLRRRCAARREQPGQRRREQRTGPTPPSRAAPVAVLSSSSWSGHPRPPSLQPAAGSVHAPRRLTLPVGVASCAPPF
jgi:hypothetical protein